MAVPGSIVGVGKLITPGGQQGPKGDAGTAANVPLADITQNGLLRQTPGLTTSFVDGTNNYQALATAVQPIIWSQTRRFFNAIGNPTFEVDQKLCGATAGFASTAALDRWFPVKSGAVAMSGTYQQISAGPSVMVPGTSVAITSKIYRTTLLAQLTTLAVTDSVLLVQYVEGPQWRELMGDVHSVSLLVRSSVAGLTFGLVMKDLAPTKTLTKLCTIPSANTWTLLTFPALPAFPSGNFVTTPGSIGYLFGICLASGTTGISPANDTWQNGNFNGALGQGNFGAQAVNSTLDIAFAQHQPGDVSTLMDKPFSQNLDECMRYYQKSYDYDVVPGAVSSAGINVLMPQSTTSAVGPNRLVKPMAKTPVMTSYNHSSGAINACYFSGNAASLAVSSFLAIGKSGFQGIVTATQPALAVGNFVYHQYTADTGW